MEENRRQERQAGDEVELPAFDGNGHRQELGQTASVSPGIKVAGPNTPFFALPLKGCL